MLRHYCNDTFALFSSFSFSSPTSAFFFRFIPFQPELRTASSSFLLLRFSFSLPASQLFSPFYLVRALLISVWTPHRRFTTREHPPYSTLLFFFFFFFFSWEFLLTLYVVTLPIPLRQTIADTVSELISGWLTTQTKISLAKEYYFYSFHFHPFTFLRSDYYLPTITSVCKIFTSSFIYSWNSFASVNLHMKSNKPRSRLEL